MYYFSTLALTLNEMEEGVAPTDSRRRPDQRLMEQGRWEEANAEKQRLEEKQRTVRREREREAARTANPADEGKRDGEMVTVSGTRQYPATPSGTNLLSLCVHVFVSVCLSLSVVHPVHLLSLSLSFSLKLSLRTPLMTRL